MISDRSQLAAVNAAIQAMADNRLPDRRERELLRVHLTAVRERIERAMAAADARRHRDRRQEGSQ
jgi:hypothetical protein